MTKIPSKTTTTSKTLTTTTATTSTSEHDWCNLDNYDVAVQQRLNSSKDIIVVDELDDKTYEEAKRVCEIICGRLYFPSTLKENDEVQSVIKRLVNHTWLYHYGNIWLRMTYNETDGTWYDPDNKEDLTFLNFDRHDRIREYAGFMEHHVIMDIEYDGKWWSRAGIQKHSPYVVCEPT